MNIGQYFLKHDCTSFYFADVKSFSSYERSGVTALGNPLRPNPSYDISRTPEPGLLTLCQAVVAAAGSSSGYRTSTWLRENRSSIARLNAGKSLGCWLVTQLPSTTTS